MRNRLKGGQSHMAVFKGIGSMIAAAVFAVLSIGAAHAEGAPTPWQIGFQEPVTAIARQIDSFHDFLMIVITLVSLFVMGLLAYIILKFNEKANPIPSKTTHNTTIEVIWTIVPILILLVICIPSFRLLFAQYTFPKADIVIKATGNQWYWSYEYPDEGGMSFDQLMLRDDDNNPIAGPNGEPRVLAVDNFVVVPVNKNVEILLTASDVIHNWTIPAFGVRVDAVPGRVIRAWFNAEKVGTYYGQCSELCGKDHAYMPIGVKVMSEADYGAWLAKAKKEFASSEPIGKKAGDTQLAASNKASIKR